eukprot:scaffold1206_cov388-Prasinococcus_capsulatus_cf.AAC.43
MEALLANSSKRLESRKNSTRTTTRRKRLARVSLASLDEGITEGALLPEDDDASYLTSSYQERKKERKAKAVQSAGQSPSHEKVGPTGDHALQKDNRDSSSSIEEDGNAEGAESALAPVAEEDDSLAQEDSSLPTVVRASTPEATGGFYANENDVVSSPKATSSVENPESSPHCANETKSNAALMSAVSDNAQGNLTATPEQKLDSLVELAETESGAQMDMDDLRLQLLAAACRSMASTLDMLRLQQIEPEEFLSLLLKSSESSKRSEANLAAALAANIYSFREVADIKAMLLSFESRETPDSQVSDMSAMQLDAQDAPGAADVHLQNTTAVLSQASSEEKIVQEESIDKAMKIDTDQEATSDDAVHAGCSVDALHREDAVVHPSQMEQDQTDSVVSQDEASAHPEALQEAEEVVISTISAQVPTSIDAMTPAQGSALQEGLEPPADEGLGLRISVRKLEDMIVLKTPNSNGGKDFMSFVSTKRGRRSTRFADSPVAINPESLGPKESMGCFLGLGQDATPMNGASVPRKIDMEGEDPSEDATQPTGHISNPSQHGGRSEKAADADKRQAKRESLAKQSPPAHLSDTDKLPGTADIGSTTPLSPVQMTRIESRKKRTAHIITSDNEDEKEDPYKLFPATIHDQAETKPNKQNQIQSLEENHSLSRKVKTEGHAGIKQNLASTSMIASTEAINTSNQAPDGNDSDSETLRWTRKTPGSARKRIITSDDEDNVPEARTSDDAQDAKRTLEFATGPDSSRPANLSTITIPASGSKANQIVLSDDSDMDLCSDDNTENDKKPKAKLSDSPPRLDVLLTKSSGAPRRRAPVRAAKHMVGTLNDSKSVENWGIGSNRRNEERDITMSSSAFSKQRVELSRKYYDEFNQKVMNGRLPHDLEIKWNPKLNSTAGLTSYKRTGFGVSAVYSAHIDLSVKVVDDVAKLRRTLAHEMCHVAAWIIDHVAKPCRLSGLTICWPRLRRQPPHGAIFKAWGRKFSGQYPEITIDTCHSYEINYAYRYQCTNEWCAKIYGRHSKSINTESQLCGSCRGTLKLLPKLNKDGTEAKARRPSEFSLYVKENFASEKAASAPGTPHGHIMKKLGDKFKVRSQTP